MSGKVFVTSDHHFDYKNIIEFCNRPFSNVKEMNEALLYNWNTKVGKDDNVYFLGDLVFSKHSHSMEYWVEKLNGDITFIKGNHNKV